MQHSLSTLKAIFAKMNAPSALAHIQRLDEGWARLLRGERPPSPLSEVSHAMLPATDAEFDLVYAGGGLGLLHALAMQQRGWRVLLFDRGVVGETHREWNISRDELGVLVKAGILTWEMLEPAIARQYKRSFIRFHNPNGAPVEFDLPGVLDLALDASRLLSIARQNFEAAGGVVWETCSFEHLWLATDGQPRLVVHTRPLAPSPPIAVGAKLLVNGMGALSPLSLALAGERLPLAGVCPTVGTVARGFAEGEVNPQEGEILVTLTGGSEGLLRGGEDWGQQLIWEGFPSRGDNFTSYLFYYDVTEARSVAPHSLQSLFYDYFELLPSYKRLGPNFEYLKPLYGFIPARHHLDGSPSEQARTARSIPSIGDAAARQNPLTFTGFGSFIRHLPQATARLDEYLHANHLEAESLATLTVAQSNLSAMWVMARFLAPRHHSDDVNSIFRDFTAALKEVGAQRAADFFLDRASWNDYIEIMLRTARHRPKVFIEAFEVLGIRGVAQWIEDLIRWKWAERASTELMKSESYYTDGISS